MKNTYQTRDIFLASVLLHLGHNQVSLVRSPGTASVTFVFTSTKDINKDVDGYYNKTLKVEPISIFAELKNLKSRLYAN